jgi:MFS family permease
MPGAASETLPSGFAPLRVRDFRLLLFGLVVSSALMPLQFVTQIFWIQQNVSEGAEIVLVGLIGSMRGIGALTFGLYGGALADRFDRRKLLMCTQSVGIALVAALASLMWLTDGGPLALAAFFALTLFSSGTYAVDAPTRNAMVPDILGPRLLPAGISLNTAGMQIAMPVSLFASGLLIDAIGFAATFALSGVGLFCEVMALTFMSYRSNHAGSPAPGRYGFRKTVADVREGVRYTRSNPTVQWVILLMVAMMALGFPAVANLGPTWITTVVDVSFRNFGFVALTWGLGAFVASLIMTRFSNFQRKGLLLACGACGFAAGFVIFAIPTVPTAVVGNLVLGISLATAQISSMTLVQLLVPNEVRGRVMSLLQLNMGMAQLLTFPVALVAQATSLEMVFPALAAAVVVLVVLIVVAQRHRLRMAGIPVAAAEALRVPGRAV